MYHYNNIMIYFKLKIRGNIYLYEDCINFFCCWGEIVPHRIDCKIKLIQSCILKA